MGNRLCEFCKGSHDTEEINVNPIIKNKTKFKILYIKNKLEKKIRIFGKKFVENNINNCNIFINGEKMSDACLVPGDEIGLGNTLLRYEIL